MKKIFYTYPNIVLGALAIVFLGTLLAFSFWVINGVFSQAGRALITPTQRGVGGFNLSAAAALDLRGLVVVTSTPAAAAQ
jgi:hypothetical protein